MLSTYRLQLNADFTLCNARMIVPYLHALGVTHLYCSPLLAARRGSTHGYDVVDPGRINPALGTEEDLRALVADLRARDMGILLDIVPNHMGTGPENPYWDDVLARGEGSRFAHWFDVEWAAHPRRKIVLPLLGEEIDRVLERGELTVQVSESGGARLCYLDTSVPVDPATLPPELQLAQWDPEAVTDANAFFAGADGAERLRALLDAQHYALVFWRRASREINYRRFFDVNDLVALRQEDPAVFDETHALLLRWVDEELVAGFRVDHVDGLLDPRGYLERLRSECDARRGPGFPIYVEKILSPGERLRAGWPVQGTTGYEFMNDLEDVFIFADGFAEVERCYHRLRRSRGTADGFARAARAGKKAVLEGALRADVSRCAAELLAGDEPADAAQPGSTPRWTKDDLVRGVVAFVAELPVYRTYVDGTGALHPDDVRVVERAVAGVRENDPQASAAAAYVGDVVLCRANVAPERRMRFVTRLQQLSGPATAKGVEDTALYVHVPLASRNEVGGAPDRPLDRAVERLHEANAARARAWPASLLSTNTHDTKRSADMRARLDAVSEVPHDWNRCVRRWQRLNRKHRCTVRGRLAPDVNAEYLLYQALVGVWPAPRPGRRADDLPGEPWLDATRERVRQYMLKAVREAKMRTSWTDPDEQYEAALMAFIDGVLIPRDDAPFLTDLSRFVASVAHLGYWNALARVAVHLTAPGVPDIYQGDELWHCAFVDPDNRRPVDFARRRELLARRPNEPAPVAPADGVSFDPADPSLKLHASSTLLHLRRRHPLLFERGSYDPVPAAGARADHVFAFARSLGGQPDGPRVVTIAARLLQPLLAEEHGRSGGGSVRSRGRFRWDDTAVDLGPVAPAGSGTWRCVLTGRTITGSRGMVPLASLLGEFPAVVLEWNGASRPMYTE